MTISNYKVDTRAAKGSWAPGNYICLCFYCDQFFIGDKRAHKCADCAYSAPETPKTEIKWDWGFPVVAPEKSDAQ